jgi:hypothetical protein
MTWPPTWLYTISYITVCLKQKRCFSMISQCKNTKSRRGKIGVHIIWVIADSTRQLYFRIHRYDATKLWSGIYHFSQTLFTNTKFSLENTKLPYKQNTPHPAGIRTLYISQGLPLYTKKVCWMEGVYHCTRWPTKIKRLKIFQVLNLKSRDVQLPS